MIKVNYAKSNTAVDYATDIETFYRNQKHYLPVYNGNCQPDWERWVRRPVQVAGTCPSRDQKPFPEPLHAQTFTGTVAIHKHSPIVHSSVFSRKGT